MKYSAAFSAIPDGYRAGIDIAHQFGSLTPDLVIVFCSDHYHEQAGELSAAIKEVCGPDSLVCGCTGDGVYWNGGVSNFGVVAMAIAAEGSLAFSATLERGLGTNSAAAAENAAQRLLAQLGREPQIAFVLADGCKADGTGLAEGLGRALPCPCFGGLAADDRKFLRSAVFLDERVESDAVLLLGVVGELAWGLSAASGWCPVGELGTVTVASGTKVKEIAKRPANDFIRDQVGESVRPSDLGTVPLAEYPDEGSEHYVLRTSSNVDENTGEVDLFGRVQEGARVRVCHASMDEITNAVDTALDAAAIHGAAPAAALVISCAGRRWLLTEAGAEEVERMKARLGDLPFIGLPSFGEIAPFRKKNGTYSPVLFHNATFVVCLLGD